MGRGYCHDCEGSAEFCWTCGVCEDAQAGGEHRRPCRDCAEVECECGCGVSRPRRELLAHPTDPTAFLASVDCVRRYHAQSLEALAYAEREGQHARAALIRTWIAGEEQLIAKHGDAAKAA